MLELAAQAPRKFLLLHCLSFWLLLTIYPSCRSLAIVAMLDTPFRPIVWWEGFDWLCVVYIIMLLDRMNVFISLTNPLGNNAMILL